MDHNSLAHRTKASLHFPIRGMESVVATVSGYHGSERFNLIKMISRSGASYVGNMNQSITHLVCWKFEGRKYELAKKFNMIVVNHRWIEDCIKKGRRLSERPYADECGEEVGPLLLDISLIADKPSKQFNSSNGSKERVIDLSEDSARVRWTDSTLLNENLLAEQSQSKHRVKRKTSRSSSREDHLSSSRYCFEDLPLYGSFKMEEDQLKLKKRSSASGEPSRRGHRLVKGNASRDSLEFLDPAQEYCQTQIFDKYSDGIVTTNCDLQRHQSILGSRHATIVLDDTEGIEDVNDIVDHKDQNLSTNGSPSPIRNLQERCSSIDGNLNDIEHSTRSSRPTELSCVICWTDFSSTRGLLECGHRFCFSCIENWSYHLRSVGKDSTCPLCKARFEKITRVDDAVPSDQKVYSQTIPLNRLGMEIYILPEGETPAFSANPSAASTCCKCFCQEPEDLLERCHLCQIRCVHIYCLDPPLFPWACDNCKDLQMLYRHIR